MAYSGGALYSAAHYIELAPADLALSAPQGLSGAVEAGESVAVSAKVSGEPVKACLDWRAEGEEYWNKQEISINDGAIEGTWETSGMAAGRYELRLRAEDAPGRGGRDGDGDHHHQRARGAGGDAAAAGERPAGDG